MSFFSVIFSGLFCVLGTASAQPSVEPIKAVIRELNKATSVEMKVRKTVHTSLMDERRENDGRVVYARGRLRLEMGAPENSLIVMNENAIWVVTPGLDEKKPQVAKITAKDLKRQSRAPLAVLLAKERTWDEFKVVKRESAEAGERFWLEPKDPQKWTDLRKVSLTLAKNGKTLKQLSYEDELENRTEYVFKDIVKNAKLSADTFVYSPPPGAEITVYQ